MQIIYLLNNQFIYEFSHLRLIDVYGFANIKDKTRKVKFFSINLLFNRSIIDEFKQKIVHLNIYNFYNN
jgi:hypothetical protein